MEDLRWNVNKNEWLPLFDVMRGITMENDIKILAYEYYLSMYVNQCWHPLAQGLGNDVKMSYICVWYTMYWSIICTLELTETAGTIALLCVKSMMFFIIIILFLCYFQKATALVHHICWGSLRFFTRSNQGRIWALSKKLGPGTKQIS